MGRKEKEISRERKSPKKGAQAGSRTTHSLTHISHSHATITRPALTATLSSKVLEKRWQLVSASGVAQQVRSPHQLHTVSVVTHNCPTGCTHWSSLTQPEFRHTETHRHMQALLRQAGRQAGRQAAGGERGRPGKASAIKQ